MSRARVFATEQEASINLADAGNESGFRIKEK